MKKLTLALMTLGVAANVYATNGTSDIGYGVVSKGMGGTGVAQAQNALSMAVNPANLVFLDRNNAELGFFLFSPRRKYTANAIPPGLAPQAYQFAVAPGEIDSGSNWFFIPNFSYSKRLNERFSTGISFYANGGMNTNYNSTAITNSGFNPDPATNRGVFGFGNTGGELRQMFLNIPLAAEITPQLSIGASFLTLIETIKVNGLTAFTQSPAFSVDPANLTNRFTYTSFGFGALIGTMAKINDYISLGASYQSKITPNKLKAYQGLFPEGRIEAPAKTTVGTSIHFNENLLLNVDYQYIDYSGTRAFGNPNSCVTGPFPCLGTASGTGFGFKSTNAIKIGGEWKFSKRDKLRAGYTHNNNPIQSSQVLLNIIAPAVSEDHFTLGYTRNINDDHSINFSFLYSPNASVQGLNAFNPGQTIRLTMHQYEFGASWIWLLDNVPAPLMTK